MTAMRVYRYGLLPPHEGGELVRKQMWLAHRYRNTLVEIERGRRAAVRLAMSAYAGMNALEEEHAKRDAECLRLDREIKATRQSSRKNSETKEMRAALEAARAARKEAKERIYALRQELRDDARVKAELALIEERSADLCRNARAYAGCYWGDYLLVEAARDKMRAACAKHGPEERHDPRFVPALPRTLITRSETEKNEDELRTWPGEGTIGVQIQKGMTLEEAFECKDTRLRLEPGLFPEKRPHRSMKVERARERRKVEYASKRKHCVLALRVESDGRDPVWARFRMHYHREIPKGAIVKECAVHMVTHGPRVEWYATITVDESACARETTCREEGITGVDLGWRLRPGGGLRVAVMALLDGSVRELALSPEWMAKADHVEKMKGLQDELFDLAKAWGASLLDTVTLPVWLARATKNLRAWRSIARLSDVVWRWERERFDGDAEVFLAFLAWRQRNLHLWQWECDERRKVLAQRKSLYEAWAKELARETRVVALEDFDMREVSKRPALGTEAERKDNETARAMRQRAAVSQLRFAIQNAITNAGGTWIKVKGAYTTKTCHACDKVEDFDAAANLYHTCSACGALWDQDENAARNIRKRGIERYPEVQKAEAARAAQNASGSAETKGSRWARAKAKKAARQAAETTARNTDANLARSSHLG